MVAEEGNIAKAVLPKAPWWPAIVLVVLGLVLHIGGYIVQQTRVSVAGFFLGLYGLMAYTVARRPAESFVSAMPDAEVDAIADLGRRRTGLAAEAYYGR